ncbi:MAG: hypothetical protein HC831_16025 [Chloroflexia bacterium]|nr:hypothetical protein [Chloroflexia bacterium]
MGFSRVFGLFKLNKPLAYRLNNFSIFKKELEKLNGFSEDYTSMNKCDADLLERLYIAGIKRKNLRFTSIMYRLIGVGTGRFGKLALNFRPDKSPICTNGLDKYPVDKQDIEKLI